MPYSTYSLTTIPRGPAGTRATLSAMERLVEGGIRDPSVVAYAQEQVRNGPEYGKMSEVESILNSVRRTMRYTPDPLGVETVKAPGYVLAEIRSKGRAVMDCDDASVWAATLIRAVGVPTRFRVIKDNPQEYTHVYLEALVDGRWVKVDPIAREVGLGRAPSGRFGSAYFEGGRMYKGLGDGSTDATMDLASLSQGGSGSISDQLKSAAGAFLQYQTQRFQKGKSGAPAQRMVVQQAPSFPWTKVLLVAGIGVGAIVALRMLRKK